MRGVYLSSVRSPALGSRYKMVHREFNPEAVFSQIPEQDESYAEDSFCVGDSEEEAQSGCSEEEEEEEEVCVNFDLLTSEAFSSSRKRYLTRHRKRLNHNRLGHSRAGAGTAAGDTQNLSLWERIPGSGCSGNSRSRESWNSLVSSCRKSHPSLAGISSNPGEHSPSLAGISSNPGGHSSTPAGISRIQAQPSPSLAGMSRIPVPSPPILADSREISSGPGVISCLRAVHGLPVRVCPLGSSDYMVSSRLAVDRVLQSELQSPGNRNKLSQRLRGLQGTFERICVIVETDRVRPGETSRFFQRTQHYDGVLSALVQAGIRILFSSCQEETAALELLPAPFLSGELLREFLPAPFLPG
uniref:FA complementation group M n=1 Tax=Zosterops lateralis melanops TaxID=1220523 RepID=A0A8D2PWE8_ZOSLA